MTSPVNAGKRENGNLRSSGLQRRPDTTPPTTPRTGGPYITVRTISAGPKNAPPPAKTARP